MLPYKVFNRSMWSDDHEWDLHKIMKTNNKTGFRCFHNIVEAMDVECPCYIALVQAEEPKTINWEIVYNRMKIIRLEKWTDEDEIALELFIKSVIDSEELDKLTPNPIYVSAAYPIIADIWNAAVSFANKTVDSIWATSIEEEASIYTDAYNTFIRRFHNWIVERKFS